MKTLGNKIIRNLNIARLRFHNLGNRASLYSKGTIIFLHIPKTAGSAMQLIIDSHYRGKEICQWDAKHPHVAMTAFAAKNRENRSRFKIVSGHLWFGLHESIPGPATYITLLRDPVERVVSHYYYVRRMPDHYLHQRVIKENLSLTQYVEQKLSIELNNGQTRQISGEWDEEAFPFGQLPRELLERAKRNLKNSFILVGIQEEFDNTLRLAEKLLGWKGLGVKENVNPHGPSLYDIPDEARQVIEYYNDLDMELYAAGKEIFRHLKKRYL